MCCVLNVLVLDRKLILLGTAVPAGALIVVYIYIYQSIYTYVYIVYKLLCT